MSMTLALSVGRVTLYTSIPKEEVNIANVFLSRQNGKQVCFSSFPIGINLCNVQPQCCLALMVMATDCILNGCLQESVFDVIMTITKILTSNLALLHEYVF